MGTGQPDLPVDDDDIETIEDWREAINDFLGEMYAMRLLCEIDLDSGTRFVQIKEAFSGSPTTVADKKNRAAALYLIEPAVRSTEDGYGTHTYWELTDVGKLVRTELQRRQIDTLHSQLKPLEKQIQSHREAVKDNGFKMPVDPLAVYSGDHDQ